MLLILLLFVLGASVVAAFPVQVTGSTHVQALISYTSPVDEACSVEVSENSNFRPLVHDINPDLFPGENLDSRSGSVSGGRDRIFIAGKRAVNKAVDGKWYSRALQTDTLHFYRIRCGNQTSRGEFRTANLPVGVTYPWPIPQDPDTGNFRWPTVNSADRNETIIDPNYGTLIRRITVPGDFPGRKFNAKTFARASGDAWTNPEASLREDGEAATCGGENCGWLVVADPGLTSTPYYLSGEALDFVRVTLRAASSAEAEENRIVEACLTIDGVKCNGEIRRAALKTGMETVTLGSTTPVDTWGETLWQHDAVSKTFGVMIRPIAGGQLSVDSVKIDAATSEMPGHPDAGNYRVCAQKMSDGGFHCAIRGGSGADANYLFWINPDTGESRWLGKVLARGWGGRTVYCSLNNVPWDKDDPNVLYCSATDPSDNKRYLLRGRYRGDNRAVEPGAVADMEWVNLTPAGNSIGELAKALDSRFDPSAFSCSLYDVVNQYAVYQCLSRGQDSAGWILAFDIGNGKPLGSGGTGRMVGALNTCAAPAVRWCGIHSIEPMDVNWIGWVPSLIESEGIGGPYAVTLQSDLPAGTGRYTVRVSGEPSPYLMDAQAGDMFRLPSANGYDFVRIASKKSSTEWVVDRVVSGASPVAQPSGVRMTAFCGARTVEEPWKNLTAYWNVEADADAKNVVLEKVMTGAHQVQRGNYRVMSAFTVVTPGPGASWNKPVSYEIPSNPTWSGVRIGINSEILPNHYQSHPSYENYNAAEPGRNNWFVDDIPFIGNLNQSLSSVDGLSQVYRVQGAYLHRDLVPTVAMCGGRQLKEVSPGPITDQDAFTFCLGGTCVPGAGPDSVFVNCPPPVSAASRCNAGQANTVCVTQLAPYGQTVTQFFFDGSGLRNRVLTNGMFSWHSSRTWLALDVATPLPDGKWVLFASYSNNARRDVYMVKVPSQPPFPDVPETYCRPVSVTVRVNPPSDRGVERVTLEYGVTTALGSVRDAQACRGGESCSFQVQARPLELLFSKPVYRGSDGRVLGEGAVQVQITSGVAGNGLTNKPVFKASAVRNAASYDQRLAPASIVSIAGDHLASCEDSASSFPLPASICDSRVSFNGRAGFYMYASPEQVNVILPSGTEAGQELEVILSRGDAQSEPVLIPGEAIQAVAPAMFSYTLEDGAPRAIIQNPDFTINGPDHPLRIGETGTAFANALGPTTPAVTDGEAAPSETPARTNASVEVYINGISQPVLFAGLAPQLSALYQVNFTLDPSTPIRGDGQNSVWLSVQGIESPHLSITIHPARI